MSNHVSFFSIGLSMANLVHKSYLVKKLEELPTKSKGNDFTPTQKIWPVARTSSDEKDPTSPDPHAANSLDFPYLFTHFLLHLSSSSHKRGTSHDMEAQSTTTTGPAPFVPFSAPRRQAGRASPQHRCGIRSVHPFLPRCRH